LTIHWLQQFYQVTRHNKTHKVQAKNKVHKVRTLVMLAEALTGYY